MQRVIKMGKRPVIVFGIMAGVLSVFILSVAAAKGEFSEPLKVVSLIVLIFGGILLSIAGNSLVVSNEGITLRSWFVLEKKINFADFDFSVPQVLMEPEHPVLLSLIKSDGVVVAEIRLKPYPKADVQWLLSLQEMKVDLKR